MAHNIGIGAAVIIVVFSACSSPVGGNDETAAGGSSSAQMFPLDSVRLLDGPFKQACDLNTEVLLEYDVDRLLAPYLKEAGLNPRGESFPNWIDLDGHVGGHYLSALAITWAATGDERIKERMEYMLSELKRCQDRNGRGYLSGVPQGAALWDALEKGNVAAVGWYWVPWYNIHKIYAGLRDAWTYGGSDEARRMFLKLCDWGLDMIALLDSAQMETMLDTEFGGMNEVYADAYYFTGNMEYLYAAKRFSHKTILNSMAGEIDNLDNKHANTVVPKAVGYARVAELTGDWRYSTAAAFFWDRVVNYRSLALGGNGRQESFPGAGASMQFVEVPEGPESCSTYNMLKLTENLFRMDPREEYAGFYERAMFNHILSTQDPDTGGYVYFTPARPEHYRVYSQVNSDMWCCVGTGMENHGKYGEFIYAHDGDSLYVNLFAASTLDWKEKGITLTQNTQFPDEENSTLVINVSSPARIKLLLRHPSWVVNGEMRVLCGGKDYAAGSRPASYIEIDRVWNDGDTVEIKIPMEITVEELPNVPQYIAIMRGPILLGAETATEADLNFYADGSRWGHIANGARIPLTAAPVIIGEPEEILTKLKEMEAVDGGFKVSGLINDEALILQPFFRIHNSRYMMYWMALTGEEYERIKDEFENEEQAKQELENRTVDRVAPGQQQPEVDHRLQSNNSYSGFHNGEGWRDARDGGYFQYELDTLGNENLALFVRYWGNENGNRTFDIFIDGQKLVTENITGKWNTDAFVNVEYPIPPAMTQGKSVVTVRFQCGGANYAGGVFYVRLLRDT